MSHLAYFVSLLRLYLLVRVEAQRLLLPKAPPRVLDPPCFSNLFSPCFGRKVGYNAPGMLSTRDQYGLEAKFCGLGLGLMGFGLGLVLGLMKHWPLSHVSWPPELSKFLCDTLNENKHVSGSNKKDGYRQLNVRQWVAYAPEIIAVNVTWIERRALSNASQHVTIFNHF